MERYEIASVADGKFHRLKEPQLERGDTWKPRLTLCGRTLTPLNYFQTANDANRYTGGRLARYMCKHCQKRCCDAVR